MKNFWEKFKELVSRAWNGLTKIGKILLGLIVVGAIILVSFLLAKDTDEDKQDNNSPEIAQVYEPSIGTPLPPDTTGGVTGDVGGVSTTEPSTTTTTEPQTTTTFVAPHAGVDLNEPIAYSNTDLKFAATLPAGSKVSEEGTRVVFNTKTNALQYIVSTNQSTESLSDVEAQLRNSTTASNISYITFNGIKTLKFTAKDYGTGYAFVSKGKIYYLLGNSQYFSTFKLL